MDIDPVSERNYLDWHYYHAGDLDADLCSIEATVLVFVHRPLPKYQTSAIILRIYESGLDYWFFEATGSDFFKTPPPPPPPLLRAGDKLELTVWKRGDQSSPICFVRHITRLTLPPHVPIGVQFTINYSDSTSLTISTRESLTTLETLQFIIKHSSNERLNEALAKQVKKMCLFYTNV